MRNRLLGVLLFGTVASLTLSLISGQERPSSPPPALLPTATPALSPVPGGITPARAASLAPARDLSRLNDLQKQFLYTAQRGADWLFRMHGVKGRFVNGYLPAVNQVMEGDSYLRQAGAASALARAARFCGEERYAARATQAVLALLEETSSDPRDSLARHPNLPSGVVNRLAGAGQLVLAISELPTPQKDLLDRSEELCRYILKQTRTDGGLTYSESGSAAEDEGVNHHPGIALAALVASHRHRPSVAKVEAVKKALPYYRAWWKAHRDLDFVPAQTAAHTGAYLLTKDRAFADFVFEMNDWVCTLQYTQIDPRRMGWCGGFLSYRNGRPIESMPTALSATYAEGLIEACRVASEVGDVTRFQRYSEAIERCLQFLATLQYTEVGMQHYAGWFRMKIGGAFHASHQDGNLRLDYTQHTVAALLGYLEHVVR